MVRVWKVNNWTEVHDRMKEGERIYSDKFPIANVTGTWYVATQPCTCHPSIPCWLTDILCRSRTHARPS